MHPSRAPWPYPSWIAHRGGGLAAPENTLAAFRAGAAAGFRMFECDVKLSSDQVPYLMHDDDLERTTSGHGPARAHGWNVLSRLDAGAWHGPAWAGEPPPTLAAIARWIRANQLAVNLEIKPCAGTEARTGAHVAGAAAGLWQGADVAPLLSSFSWDALEAARGAAPALPRALLLDHRDDDRIAQAVQSGCVAVVLHHPLADPLRIAALQAQGLRVLAYTVNDPGEAERLRTFGIDGLITDALETFGPAARAELNAPGATPPPRLHRL